MAVPAVLSATPPDLSAIITSLGIFSLAVAAVVAGIYKGIKDIKKGGAETGHAVAAAALIETTTISAFTESNVRVADLLHDLVPILSRIERHLDLHEQGEDRREHAMRASTEEAHRLRVAVTDLHQFMRTQR